MKAVILAAGQGKRMQPLTFERPKPLLEVSGKCLIEHVISALPSEVDELIVVVGYLEGQIKAFLGPRFLGKRVTCVTQPKLLGTGEALKRAEPYLSGDRFFLLTADDLHDPDALKACLSYDRAMVVCEHQEPSRFGVVVVNSDGMLQTVVEKPSQPISNLVWTGALLLDRHIFSYQPKLEADGEYYVVDALLKMLLQHPVHAVRTKNWFPLARPDDLPAAEEFLRRQKI